MKDSYALRSLVGTVCLIGWVQLRKTLTTNA